MNKPNYQAVFFDFDGVILDSANIKTIAFAEMFKEFGVETASSVVAHHLANEGISRFEKFKYIYENILHKPIDQDLLDELGKKFNRLVFEKVLTAPFIEGAYETLQDLKRNETPAFVASGAPHEEVKLIVETRKLAPYFTEVHGSPRKKKHIIKDVCNRYGFEPIRCLFIGDAMTDYEAAIAAGTHFLGIVGTEEESVFPDGTRISPYVHADLPLGK